MAEITKVTTPMIPRENLGKNRPVTEQAFELNNPTKVNKPKQDKNVMDRETGGQALREALGRAAVAPLLRDSTDSVQQVQRMIALLQMGYSTSDIVTIDPMREMLESMFVTPGELAQLLAQQDDAALLFRGEAFDILRDIVARFDNMPNVKDAVVNLLKSYDLNVNVDNSVKTILYQCENLLDYMFSQDRSQFGEYLDNLADMLFPQQGEPAQTGTAQPETAGQTVLEQLTQQDEVRSSSSLLDEFGAPVIPEAAENQTAQQSAPQLGMYAGSKLGVAPNEAAQVLKNNLLPLLGEIVVKYYQSESIRDIVMVCVHNIVRVDKGTPEAMGKAVDHLVEMLGRVANLNENFGANMKEALTRSLNKAKLADNDVLEKISSVISQALHSPESSPAAIRQAEYLLLSMLQNQSPMMSLLHYILPLDTPDGRAYAEMYVDPDSEEAKTGGEEEKGRKVFLSVESDRHGSIELCFWECGERVDFAMWCPEHLLAPLKAIKKPVSNIMAAHGYTMTGYAVEELKKHHSIIQVFPKLLERKVGIDVSV